MSDYECFVAWLMRTYPTHARPYSSDPVIQSAFFAGLEEKERRLSATQNTGSGGKDE